jgi:hypothetical protein
VFGWGRGRKWWGRWGRGWRGGWRGRGPGPCWWYLAQKTEALPEPPAPPKVEEFQAPPAWWGPGWGWRWWYWYMSQQKKDGEK